MENGKGGGGGGGGGGFSYGNINNNFNYYNLQNHHPHFQATLPTTPIDRFLWSENNNQISQYHQTTLPLSLQPSYYNPSSNNNVLDLSNVLSSINNGHIYHQNDDEGLSWPSQAHISFSHAQLLNMEQIKFDGQTNILENLREGLDFCKKNGGGSGKNAKNDPLCLIKGQWTEEEDRRLMELVKKHGIKKWSLISEEMYGRAGKQCRERWHNHLRSNIKKEPWSEAEERLLVESHKKLSNRWCEIAKKIPGRTENSIKNHWNATKRKLDSRKRGKRQPKQNENKQSSILQDYIMSYYANKTSSISTSSLFPTKITPSSMGTSTSDEANIIKNPTKPPILENLPTDFDIFLADVSDSINDQDNNNNNNNNNSTMLSFDDELNFIQSTFGGNAFVGSSSCAQNPIKVERSEQQYIEGNMGMHEFPAGLSSTTSSSYMDSNIFITNNPEDNKLMKLQSTIITPDNNKYLANLLLGNAFGSFSY